MISVVVPVYNEEENVIALHTAMQEAMNATGEEWEVVYVNDGSRDQSLSLLLQYQAHDPHVVVVNLSRNWGHQGAITAGLSIAKGDAVVTMDGDLQDHPSVIPRMLEAWRGGAQIVLAERRTRQDKGIKAWLYPVFYKVLGKIADYPIPMNSGIFGLIDRKVADQINALPEKNRYIPGLKTFVGFHSETIFYDRLARNAGIPKYTWRKLIRYAFDAIYSFSYKPLRLALVSGGALLSITLAIAVALMIGGLSGVLKGSGWIGYAAGLTGLLFVSGLQLTCLGFMGEYIGRIYDEVRHRPLFVIDDVYRVPAHSVLQIDDFRPVADRVNAVVSVGEPAAETPSGLPVPSAA